MLIARLELKESQTGIFDSILELTNNDSDIIV